MKKTKLKWLLVLLTLFTLLFSTFSFADNETENNIAENETSSNGTNVTGENNEQDNNEPTEDNNTTSDNSVELEQHKGSFHQVGNVIDVNKAIDGNAYVFGNDVTISGQINGDLFVFATNKLTFAEGSAIFGNVFAFSNNINLDGLVYNLYAVCDNFTCEYNGMAALDIKVMANKITYSGYMERNLYLVATESLNITEDAYILGNLTYFTNFEPTISENAAISGDTVANRLDAYASVIPTSVIVSNYVTSILTSLAVVCVAFLILLVWKPNFISNTTKQLGNKYLSTFGIGLLALIVVPIISILLLYVNVLSTVAFLLLAIYLIMLALSMIATTFVLAQKLDNTITKTKKSYSLFIYILLVTLVIWAISFIPVVGAIIYFLLSVFGFGILIKCIFTKNKDQQVVETVSTTQEIVVEDNQDKTTKNDDEENPKDNKE